MLSARVSGMYFYAKNVLNLTLFFFLKTARADAFNRPALSEKMLFSQIGELTLSEISSKEIIGQVILCTSLSTNLLLLDGNLVEIFSCH